MTGKSRFAALLLALTILMSSGCAANQKIELPSPTEFFLDAVASMIDGPERDPFEEANKREREKRLKWEHENSK